MTPFKFKQAFGAAFLALGLITAPVITSTSAQATSIQTETAVHYQTVKIDGINIFYREAGAKDAPTLLLLHGFPTSSQQYRNLIPALADKYHVIAPIIRDLAVVRCQHAKILTIHSPLTPV